MPVCVNQGCRSPSTWACDYSLSLFRVPLFKGCSMPMCSDHGQPPLQLFTKPKGPFSFIYEQEGRKETEEGSAVKILPGEKEEVGIGKVIDIDPASSYLKFSAILRSDFGLDPDQNPDFNCCPACSELLKKALVLKKQIACLTIAAIVILMLLLLLLLVQASRGNETCDELQIWNQELEACEEHPGLTCHKGSSFNFATKECEITRCPLGQYSVDQFGTCIPICRTGVFQEGQCLESCINNFFSKTGYSCEACPTGSWPADDRRSCYRVECDTESGFFRIFEDQCVATTAFYERIPSVIECEGEEVDNFRVRWVPKLASLDMNFEDRDCPDPHFALKSKDSIFGESFSWRNRIVDKNLQHFYRAVYWDELKKDAVLKRKARHYLNRYKTALVVNGIFNARDDRLYLTCSGSNRTAEARENYAMGEDREGLDNPVLMVEQCFKLRF